MVVTRHGLHRKLGGKIRSKLGVELGNADDVIIEEGSAGEAGKTAAQTGMRRSVFCLSPAGDTPSSARLFDAIVSGCIPVIVSDELELPFEGILDYRKIALFVSSSDAVQPGWLLTYLRSIKPTLIREMQDNLTKDGDGCRNLWSGEKKKQQLEIEKAWCVFALAGKKLRTRGSGWDYRIYMLLNYLDEMVLRGLCIKRIHFRPSKGVFEMYYIINGPVPNKMTGDSYTIKITTVRLWSLKLAGKLINIKLHTRRSQRFVKESRSICTCDCRRSNTTFPLVP
ncbi:hypothetical protein R6Q57_002826 [Mikania cordata]